MADTAQVASAASSRDPAVGLMRSARCGPSSSGWRPCRWRTPATRAGRGSRSPSSSASRGRRCTRSTQAAAGRSGGGTDMLERFTSEARATVVGAQQEARRLGAERIGTEYLLLGLLEQDGPAAAVLTGHGLTRDAVAAAIVAHTGGDELDAEALGTLGIDLDAV